MNRGPTTWGGWRKPASAMSPEEAASGGFPELLHSNWPAYCLSTDDLPTVYAVAVAASAASPSGSHEWNVAKFRRMIVCDPDTGERFQAYVCMTDPMPLEP